MLVTFIIVHIILGTWQHCSSHPCYVARTVPMLALYSVSMRCQCCVNAVSMLSHSLYPGCFSIPGLAVQHETPEYQYVAPGCFESVYAFILLTSTLVPGINYFVVTTHPLHR